MENLKLGVQLYTVRAAAEKDLAGLFKSLRAIGYTAAELAGYGDLKTADAVRRAADKAGVKIASGHVPLDAIETNVARVIAEQKTLGCRSVVVPSLPAQRLKTPTDWIAAAERLNAAGKRLADAGLSLGYHNHAFEFDMFDGQTGMTLLLEHTDPAVVGFEVDVYWVAHARHDPVGFCRSLGRRLRFLHLKDRAADGKFAAVGTGTLDFSAICRAGDAAGVEWGFVEQDECYGQDPLAALRTSFESLKKLGYA